MVTNAKYIAALPSRFRKSVWKHEIFARKPRFRIVLDKIVVVNVKATLYQSFFMFNSFGLLTFSWFLEDERVFHMFNIL